MHRARTQGSCPCTKQRSNHSGCINWIAATRPPATLARVARQHCSPAVARCSRPLTLHSAFTEAQSFLFSILTAYCSVQQRCGLTVCMAATLAMLHAMVTIPLPFQHAHLWPICWACGQLPCWQPADNSWAAVRSRASCFGLRRGDRTDCTSCLCSSHTHMQAVRCLSPEPLPQLKFKPHIPCVHSLIACQAPHPCASCILQLPDLCKLALA